jgi:N-methylhydantoinase B
VKGVSAQLDPISFEVIKNALDSIADQAAITLMRSAYSTLIRDSLDYSTAVCDARGRMLAQGLTTPFHLGSFPDAMRHLIDGHDTTMAPGDVFLANDPYGSGGIHLPDFYVIKPVFHDARRVGFITTLAHQQDVGGITPGSNSVHSEEIYQEGLRIPLLKLYDAGEPNATLLAIIAKNTRVPTEVLGDVHAQVAGCLAGEKALIELIEKFGNETLERYYDALLDHAERQMRFVIAQIPDGRYEFTDYIDGLGADPVPLRFQVAVTVDGDELLIDWTGTAPQVRAGLNAPLPFTKSATYLAARVLVAEDLPNNEGYMRPLRTVAPPGTIVNAVEPAACATRGIVGMRCFDAILGALAVALPERIPAAGEGGVSWPTIGGWNDGKPFVYAESIMGSWGGRPFQDGVEGIAHPGANQPNQPVEMIEATKPLRVRRYGLVPDTGGAGKHRGGLALVKEWEVLAPEAVLTIRSDRRDHLPYGLHGGRPGTPSSNVVNPGEDEVVLPVLPMEVIRLKRGDVFRHVIAGGGGWGDPLERDPAAVLEDVLDEKVSVAYARAEYGVVIDLEQGTVDVAATQAVRAGSTQKRVGLT